MKKLLLSSIVLLIFSTTIIIFQMSCQKTALAQHLSNSQNLNKTLLGKDIQTQIGTTSDSLGHVTPIYIYTVDFYLVNNDGTNLTKVNMTLPTGLNPNLSGALSSDGEKIIFNATNYITHETGVYLYSLNSSNLIKLVDGNYHLEGTY